jgi:NADH-quinone oxidoreductase subunit M
MLELLFTIPIFGSLLIVFTSRDNIIYIRNIALYSSLITFFMSVLVWIEFDYFISKFQFVNKISWFSSLNINFFVGIDGVSLLFILLTTFIFPLCILTSWKSIKENLKEYMIVFLMMEALLIIVFCILDLLLFYVFFESILIPIFLIVGILGSRRRRIRASYMLFLYTLLGLF